MLLIFYSDDVFMLLKKYSVRHESVSSQGLDIFPQNLGLVIVIILLLYIIAHFTISVLLRKVHN